MSPVKPKIATGNNVLGQKLSKLFENVKKKEEQMEAMAGKIAGNVMHTLEQYKHKATPVNMPETAHQQGEEAKSLTVSKSAVREEQALIQPKEEEGASKSLQSSPLKDLLSVFSGQKSTVLTDQDGQPSNEKDLEKQQDSSNLRSSKSQKSLAHSLHEMLSFKSKSQKSVFPQEDHDSETDNVQPVE